MSGQCKGVVIYTCDEVLKNNKKGCLDCGWKCWKDEKKLSGANKRNKNKQIK